MEIGGLSEDGVEGGADIHGDLVAAPGNSLAVCDPCVEAKNMLLL
jgi:hypothetical protein